MIVTIIAHTAIVDMPESIIGTAFDTYTRTLAPMQDEADTLAQFAGRACYQAWEMPNPKTANNDGYLANIISQQHFSVLEHGSATFYVEGISRNMTHELVRHRHLSYSELSQRYVDMSEADVIIAPAMRGDFGSTEPLIGSMEGQKYNYLVEALMKDGKTRKEAREAARFVLPSGMETKIVVSGNHRAWRDMLHKRYSAHADAEIREFATIVLGELRKIAPATYQDFPDTPFE